MLRVLCGALIAAIAGLTGASAIASDPSSTLPRETSAALTAGTPGPLRDVAELEASRDSLCFSYSQRAEETVPEPDKGSGIVRAILLSSFGKTELAGLLFERRAILYVLLGGGAIALAALYRRGERVAIELPVAVAAMGAGRTLPLVGEAHPLGRVGVRFSQRAAGLAILLHLLLLGTWLVARDLPRVIATGGGPRFIVLDMPPPPSLLPLTRLRSAEPTAPADKVAAGLPAMVDDATPLDITIAGVEDLARLLDVGSPGAGGDAPIEVVAPSPPPTPELVIGHDPRALQPGTVPVLLSMPQPVYPEMARTAEVEGSVLLQLLVGEDGRVKDVKVTHGHSMLIAAAVQAAWGGRFRPATQQGRPVAVWVEFPVRFALY